MATGQAFQGQQAAAQGSVDFHGLFRVLGACGLKAANGGEQGRDRELIQAYAGKDDGTHGVGLFPRVPAAAILLDFVDQRKQFPLGGVQYDIPGVAFFLGDGHNIHRQDQTPLMEPEELPQNALDPVPDGRAAHLARDGQTEPPMLFAVRPLADEQQKALGVIPAARIIAGQELFSFSKPKMRGKG